MQIDFDSILSGILGGIIPGLLVLFVYVFKLSAQLSRIETDINWLKGALKHCLPH